MAGCCLEFWFEFASSYSYPAALRIEQLARSAGVRVLWRPFLLGPLFQAQGYASSPFVQFPAKGRYMWRDIERICARTGIPFRKPSAFPRTSVLGARIACAFQDEPWVPRFVCALFTANFAHDRDIGDDRVVADCLTACGESAPARIAAVQTDPLKSRLRTQTERAAALGLFGAPSFLVDGELFWGNDRLEDALAWARGEHPLQR
ncbi:2-hydroxychromene-2-carboxylate isomerase [Fontimonas thermophila]|uniref:2-hydroxychromene-2-carboxylate isomerase n=1 Tax=Fontimonas thermophila TaxID=1076937 RepID=A0A1I2JD90_9GAMM|nr:2-hydroxychromene-2-carboxylate isomerase [Fontimonas thermophila]SFF50651.1 2-hydroxychromene-2-carboxylate isomerase [Fontimonas thermophila]